MISDMRNFRTLGAFCLAFAGCSTPGKGWPEDPLLQGRVPTFSRQPNPQPTALAFAEPALLIDPATKQPIETPIARGEAERSVKGVLMNRPKLPD